MLQVQSPIDNNNVENCKKVIISSSSFLSVNSLSFLQWYFTSLSNNVSLKPGIQYTRGIYNKWRILNVISNNNDDDNNNNKFNKDKDYIISPTTSVLFKFPSYKIILCLDISASQFFVLDDGTIPLSTLKQCVLSSVKRIWEYASQIQWKKQTSKSKLGDYIDEIFLSIIAHRSEYDETFSIWQGEITEQTDIQLLITSLQAKMDSIEIECQYVSRSDIDKTNKDNNAGGEKEADVCTFLKAMLFHVDLMPRNACPKAVLFTSGSINIDLIHAQNVWSKSNTSLHIVVEKTTNKRPAGYYADILGLDLLASISYSGSMKLLTSSLIEDRQSLCKDLFNEEFFVWSLTNKNLLERVVERSTLCRRETKSESYSFDGVTLEHLIGLRISEGFNIIDISTDMSLNDSNGLHTPSPKHTRHFPWISVRLEKVLSKTSSLIYELQFCRHRSLSTSPFPFATPSPSNSNRFIRRASTLCKGKPDNNDDCWTRGSCTVHIKRINSNAYADSISSSIVSNDEQVGQILQVIIPDLGSSFNTEVKAQTLAPFIDVIEKMTKLDENHTFFYFLRAWTASHKTHSLHKAKLSLFERDKKLTSNLAKCIFSNFQCTDFYELDHNRWCGIIGNSPKHLKNMQKKSPKQAVSIKDDIDTNILILHIREICNTFLTISIGKISKGLTNIPILKVRSAVLESLLTSNYFPLVLNNDISLYSISPNHLSRRKSKPCLQGARSVTEVTVHDEIFSQMMLSALVQSKVNAGFQCSYFDREADATNIYLLAACPSSPSGIDMECLLQCNISCSSNGTVVEYYWPKSCNDLLFEQSRSILNLRGYVANDNVESLMSLLMEQDYETFQLYSILDRFKFCSNNIDKQRVSLNDSDIKLIDNIADKEVVYLPCLSFDSLYSRANVWLFNKLFESLHQKSNLGCIGIDLKGGTDLVCGYYNDDVLYILLIPSLTSMVSNEVESTSDDLRICPIFPVTVYILKVTTLKNRFSDQLQSFASSTVSGFSDLGYSTVLNENPVSRSMEVVNFLKALNKALWKFHNVHYAQASYVAMTEGLVITSVDLELCISRCMHSLLYEVDVTMLYKKRSMFAGFLSSSDQTSATVKGIHNPSPAVIDQSAASLLTSFNSTLGKYLKGIPERNIFIVSNENDALKQNDQVENAAFVRFSIISKGMTDGAATTSHALPCTAEELAETMMKICNSQSVHELALKMDFMIAGTARDEIDESTTKLPDLSNKLFRKLSQTTREFVATETLSSLLKSTSNITAENVAVVQQCLNEVSRVHNVECSLDFVSTSFNKRQAAGYHFAGTSMNYDPVTSTFESELRFQVPGISKIGDVLYARSWTCDDRMIPCWILISLNHIQNNSAATTDAMTTNTMKVQVSLNIPEAQNFSSDSEFISSRLLSVLEKCSFRVNQRLLLKSLHETRVASPFLLAPSAPVSTSQNTKPDGGASNSPTLTATKTQSTHLGMASKIPPRVRPPIPVPTTFVKPAMKAKNSTEADKSEASVSSDTKTYAMGHFKCPLQSEITCLIHTGTALPLDVAIRHLESSALSQFVISSHEGRYFVTQDANGNVFYMTFDNASDAKVIRLRIFGIDYVDKVLIDQLKALLDHRLIEITAKTISSVLARNASLPLSYMAFLKQSRQQVKCKIFLPTYIKDAYFYCVIARQCFLWTQVLGKVIVAGSQNERRTTSLSECLHPATFGYDLSAELLTENNNDSSPPSMSSHLAKPSLVRKGHVDEELSNSKLISPAFFGRKNKIQKLKVTKKVDECRIVWQKNDFTFLYNNIGALPSNATTLVKNATKQIGQGLALVQFQPVHNIPNQQDNPIQIFLSGLQSDLEDDINAIEIHMKGGKNISTGKVSDNDSSKLQILLSVYPTVPMQSQSLVDFCTSVFDQAAAIYCLERVHTSFFSDGYFSEVAKDDYSKKAVSDLLRFNHSVASRIKSSSLLPPTCGTLRIPFSLPKSYAKNLLDSVLKDLLESHPFWKNHDVIESSGTTVSFRPRRPSSDSMSDALKLEEDINLIAPTWSSIDSSDKVTSYFLTAGHKADSNIALSTVSTDIRILQDCDSAVPTSLPVWLRRRAYSMELSISVTGLTIFFFNLSPTFVNTIFDIASSRADKIVTLYSETLKSQITQLGIVSNESSSFNQILSDRNALMLQQLNRLHWDRRVMFKLYSNPSDFRQNRDTKCLEKLPKHVWRRGFIIDSFTIPMPLIDKSNNNNNDESILAGRSNKDFATFVEALKVFSIYSDCDVVGESLDRVVYIMFPIPRKTFVNVVEINAKANSISMIYRVIDIVDIIIPSSKDTNDRAFYAAMQDMFENSKVKEDQKSTKPLMLRTVLDGAAVRKWRSSLLLLILSYTIDRIATKALDERTQILQLFETIASLVDDKVFYDCKRIYPMTNHTTTTATATATTTETISKGYVEEKEGHSLLKDPFLMRFPFCSILASLKRKANSDIDFSFFKSQINNDDDIVCFAFIASSGINDNENLLEGICAVHSNNTDNAILITTIFFDKQEASLTKSKPLYDVNSKILRLTYSKKIEDISDNNVPDQILIQIFRYVSYLLQGAIDDITVSNAWLNISSDSSKYNQANVSTIISLSISRPLPFIDFMKSSLTAFYDDSNFKMLTKMLSDIYGNRLLILNSNINDNSPILFTVLGPDSMKFLLIIFISKYDSNINLIENVEGDTNDEENLKMFRKQETLTEDIIEIFLYAISTL